MILYVNSCVREGSRTDKLARALLGKMGEYTEIVLEDADINPLNRERLEYRMSLLERGCFDDPCMDLAKQFASADVIVIGAPYWDGSFPSSLKAYIENIYVTGIVSEYDDKGGVVGLCKADKLYYVTTAGGPYESEYSYGYIKKLSGHFGIKNTELIYAENLDIAGNDPEAILREAIENLEA